MATIDARSPLQPGEEAPDFALPAVDREETVSMADYRGRSPVFLAFFRGLYCPFCRRAIAQLGTARDRLAALGVEALGVVATTSENARLYFRFRPTRLRLAADPDMTTYSVYGLPRPAVTPELMQGLESVRINPTGELPEPLPLVQAAAALDRLRPHAPTETDQADSQRQFPQLTGSFLVDREGLVRWAHIECAQEGLAGLGKFPTDEEILGAARALSRG